MLGRQIAHLVTSTTHQGAVTAVPVTFQMFPNSFFSLSRNERAGHQLSNITTSVQECPVHPLHSNGFHIALFRSQVPV